MQKKGKCPICNTEIEYSPNYDQDTVFYLCPVCGRFELSPSDKINYNHLASYLIHNRYQQSSLDYRYHTSVNKETCEMYKKNFEQGDRTNGYPIHMDAQIVENWYPKTLSERIDLILLFLYAQTNHIGQEIILTFQELLSAFFIDRNEYIKNPAYDVDERKQRDIDICEKELLYMLDYMEGCEHIKYSYTQYLGDSKKDGANITILPQGYMRIDVLQKNTAYGRNVLVAMKFGNETIPLREAIRKGVHDAGYIAIFIDEVQHNDFITPELLKYIRDSKFVVVDLTHKNNGAYFEEGYAMGLGKTVIQLCHKDTSLHFDVAQKNTIMWENEDEIAEKLENRIRATID